MEKAVAQRVPQEGLDEGISQLVQIVAGSLQPLNIRHLDAVDPFHGDDIAAGAFPIYLRNAESGVFFGIFGKFGKGGGLKPQIHLDLGCLFQRASDFHRPQAAGRADETLLQVGDQIHRLQIVLEALANAGANDLDGDLARPFRRIHYRRVNLGDGSGGDRIAKFPVEFRNRPPERTFNISLGRGCGENAMRSCRLARSSAKSAPTTSGLVARNCPIFT